MRSGLKSLGRRAHHERLVLTSIILCWIALPSIPITLAWRAVCGSKSIRSERGALLLITSASYCWIILGFILPWLIGPDYSSRRYTTILSNLIGMVVLALWAAVRGRGLRSVPLSSLATASVWFYALGVSSVV
jgi:hypothetical protein